MSQLIEKIQREIVDCGIIPFSRFMELALYCPQLGFYERKKDSIGRAGDFYTNSSVGPFFGELLAFRFAEWLSTARDAEGGRRIIEAGAHDGRLAADILGWMRRSRPQLYERLEYVIVEPSAMRRQWQHETLEQHGSHVCWLDSLPTTDDERFGGIIFSNELFDAFPVHRLGWDANREKWFEWGVAFAGGQLVWAQLPGEIPSSLWPVPSAPELWKILPDGYIVEVCPDAEVWYRQAAGALKSGRIVTIDYGFAAEQLFAPERQQGTLRAYQRHQVSHDLLANPGEQDLTAHVNFSALQRTGEAAGLRTEGFLRQAQWLTPILAQMADAGVTLTSTQVRQFQTLVHPEHMGRAFRVLVQAR